MLDGSYIVTYIILAMLHSKSGAMIIQWYSSHCVSCWDHGSADEWLITLLWFHLDLWLL